MVSPSKELRISNALNLKNHQRLVQLIQKKTRIKNSGVPTHRAHPGYGRLVWESCSHSHSPCSWRYRRTIYEIHSDAPCHWSLPWCNAPLTEQRCCPSSLPYNHVQHVSVFLWFQSLLQEPFPVLSSLASSSKRIVRRA